jgi:hypothetical protein
MKDLNREDFECDNYTIERGCTELLDSLDTLYAYPLPTTIPDLGPLQTGDDAVEGLDY